CSLVPLSLHLSPVSPFSLHRSVDLRVLHSFPTRRSSDLSLIELPAAMTHSSIPAETRRDHGVADGLVRLSVGIEDVADLISDLRSEEHTSELQSRSDLVCRLLLEKKKKRDNNR